MERTAGSTSSTEASGREEVAVGLVIGAHGLRGELRVRLPDERIENLRATPTVRLVCQQGDPNTVEARVRAVRTGRAGEALLSLEGVGDRDAAEKLLGREIRVDAEQLERLPDGEYYQYQLVGGRVEDREGKRLGIVTGIWETGASDVLVVEDGGREHLIPAAFLREVETDARRIVVELPPGLIEPEGGAASRKARSEPQASEVERKRK